MQTWWCLMERFRLGVGEEVTLVAPIDVECGRLSLEAPSLVVEGSDRDNRSAVFVRAEDFDATIAPTVTVRGPVEFCACWPGARAYPWTQFRANVTESDNGQTREGLRRLRKFVTAFRAHGREELGRYRGKIESPRMTKGAGSAVLRAMCAEGILRVEGKWYILDTGALGEKVGVNYVDCQAYRFGREQSTLSNGRWKP